MLRTSFYPFVPSIDFNSQPSEALYALLVGDPLTQVQIRSMQTSRVVHISLDPSITYVDPGGISKDEEDDEGGGRENGEDSDPVLTNTRPAIPEDGLLSVPELVQLFPGPSSSLSLPGLRSAYDSSFQSVLAESELDAITRAKERAKTFSNNSPRPPGGDTRAAKDSWDTSRKGGNEPMHTSFTHYWRSTLVRLETTTSSLQFTTHLLSVHICTGLHLHP